MNSSRTAQPVVATRSRGYLPHWERNDAIYFVTFRLKDSLPRPLLEQLVTQRRIRERAIRAGTSVRSDDARLSELHALLRRAERSLDHGLGACHMRNPRVARIVADAITHFDGERYRFFAWCVMPNHVHAVLSPVGDYALDEILHSWKSFSAAAANRLLRRTGGFWQREYFDHLVRHQGSLSKIIRYVGENPRRAGLQNWPWVKVAPEEVLRDFVSRSRYL